MPFTEKKLHSPTPQVQNANTQIRENTPSNAENRPVTPAHTDTPPAGEKPPAIELRPTEITAIKARSALSISNMLAPKKEPSAAETKYAEEKKDEAFTSEQLLSLWNKYAAQAKDDKRIGLYTAMCSADVSLKENHTIGIAVSSTVIAREIENEIPDILRFLKDALNNTQITHSITVSESAREHIPYTPREKYEYLRLKNPLIEELRRTLDLNIDF